MRWAGRGAARFGFTGVVTVGATGFVPAPAVGAAAGGVELGSAVACAGSAAGSTVPTEAAGRPS